MLDRILIQLGRKSNGQANGPPQSMDQAARWREALAQLHALHEVEDDWDGQGAHAPEAVNIQAAVAWAEKMQPHLAPPTRIMPGLDGEVLFLWQGRDYYLEGEIETPAKIEWMLAVPGQAIEHWETPLAPEFIPTS